LSFRRERDEIYPKENPGERRDILSNVLSIYSSEIPSMFSFRFRATERRKVRDRVPMERDRTIEDRGKKEVGKKDTIRHPPPRRCKRDWRVCRAIAYRVAHFGVRSKKRRERAVT